MLNNYELNKIYNEDSYKAIKNLPDQSIDLIIVDPPYEVDTVGGDNNLGKALEPLKNALEESEIVDGIDTAILDEFWRVMKKPNIYIWCNKKQVLEYMKYFIEVKGCSFEILTWLKPNPSPLCGGNYLIDKEFCLYFRKGVKLNTKFETAKTFWIQKLNIADKKLYEHPTIKPLNIIKTLIGNSSNPGDIVADFFMGSGTTAVAAKELDRQFIGFEISEKWHKVATDRLNGITANQQTSIFTDFDNL